jgi:hypothetical protein
MPLLGVILLSENSERKTDMEQPKEPFDVTLPKNFRSPFQAVDARFRVTDHICVLVKEIAVFKGLDSRGWRVYFHA